MAKKAYEESNIAAIAETIRTEIGENSLTFTTAQMPEGVRWVHSHGAAVGYNEGYEDGYNDGYGEGYGEGKSDGYDEGSTEGYYHGVEDGKAEQYDAFWDSFQSAATSFWAKYAGNGWTIETFRPKNDLNIVNGNASYCFAYSICQVDLVEWCEELGINITIQPTVVTGIFQSSRFTRVPVIDTSLADSLSNSFAYCSYLTTVDKLIIKNDGSQKLTNTFYDCKVLENITIEGVIGHEIKLQWSPLLTPESMISIITHLKDYSGTDKAFTEAFYLGNDSWSKLEAHSTSPSGGTWEDYVTSLGWNT